VTAGADGCKDKWIAVVESHSGRTEIWEPQPFGGLCRSPSLELIVIDIPIGLVNSGAREADTAARRFLRQRACCVFTAPIRPMLDCQTWVEACSLRFEIEAKKISKQQFGILSKVREVDAELRRGAGVKVREGHPEVSFAIMNGDSPIPISKKKRAGKAQRQELIYAQFPDAKLRISECRIYVEDILDAYALLWTARRIQHGSARRFPSSGDPCGVINA